MSVQEIAIGYIITRKSRKESCKGEGQEQLTLAEIACDIIQFPCTLNTL